jgi:hypothetical protein
MRYLTLLLLAAACAQTETQHPGVSESTTPGKPADSASMTAVVSDSTPRTPDKTARPSGDSVHADAQPYSALYQVRQPDTAELAAARADGRAFRVGSELRIRLLNGKTATFADDTTAGLKFSLPRYAGYLKSIHSHVIHILQYEGSGAYLVVDDSTGGSTIVFGEPIASPDGKRFVLTSMAGAGAGYDASMIEVWRMVGRKPEKEFSYETEGAPWEASDAAWRDSVTIDFDKNTFISFDKPYKKAPGRLTRTGTTWVFSDR